VRTLPPTQLQFQSRQEHRAGRGAASLAWTWASEHPGAALALFGPKLESLFGSDEAALGYWSKRVLEPSQSALITRVRAWNERYYLALLALGGIGIVRSVWVSRRSRAWLLWLPPAVVVAFTVLHLLTFGDPCYHHPMMPWSQSTMTSFGPPRRGPDNPVTSAASSFAL